MAAFFSLFGKRKDDSLDIYIERIQKGDKQLQNEILEQYTPFIAKTVSTVCKRYVSECDDEFSIGLIAFNEAIEKFSIKKGKSFLSFAKIVIKSRVIDYIRKESKNPATVTITPSDQINEYDDKYELNQSNIEADISINEYNKEFEKKQRKEEIFKFQQVLSEFGLKFTDLIDQAPKHYDARKTATDIAYTLIENEELKTLFLRNKKLPIKDLEKLVSVSRKTIERNRKYIIAIAIIFDGDFVFLKDYLK